MSSIKLDPRVSPSLHPAVVANLPCYGDATKGYVEGTERAFREAYDGVAAVFDAREAAKRDLSLTEAGRTIKVGDMAERVFKRVAANFDAQSANLSKGIAQIEEKLNAPVTARAAHPMAAEIRAYIRGMQESDRPGFVFNAITRGDLVTAEAALAGPSYLCGLTPEGHAALLRKYHEQAAPEEAAKLALMKGALALLSGRGGMLFGALEQAVGAKPHEVQALRQAKARADKALAV
jgi:hypothetical protein